MIKENPFYILEVSTRDTRQKIVEMAEDKSLELDEELVQKAQSNLVTPSRRLTAELDWFPGVAPARISKIIDALDSGNLGQINQYDLPVLAQINFYIELLENENVHLSKQNLRDYIENIVKVFDLVDVDIILRDINEDRMIAKFPEIDNPEPILTAIAEKKRIIVKAILNRLNQLDIEDLIQTLTEIVDDATSHGEYPSSDIIDDIVDDYKLHVQKFLEEEAEKIEQAIEIIQEKASKGEKVIEPLVDKLLNAIQKWDDVAQPIQLSTKSRGTNDVISEDVARKVRSLGIDLFNNYQYVKLSQKISEKIKILFEELPEVHEQIKDDIYTIENILSQKEQAKKEREIFIKSLSYHAEIGIVFKDILSISNGNVSWKGKTFSLESITKTAWGGVAHSVNGIPTGTTYTIKFGNSKDVAIVETKRESIFIEFTEKLWKGIATNIIADMIQHIINNGKINFHNTIIWDDGITLENSGWFSSDKKKFSWNEISIWSEQGNFIIADRNSGKFTAEFSYINVYNVHFLEQMIRILFKDTKVRLLSDLL